MFGDNSSVNLIMVTYNALNYTRYTLNSLFANTDSPFYLTIVDNNSVDGTREFLKEVENYYKSDFLLGYKYILKDENTGYGGAINEGYKSFASKYTGLLNNDLKFSKGWLHSVLTTFKQVPNAGLIGPARPATYIKHPFFEEDTKKIVDSSMEEWSIEEELQHFCNNNSFEFAVEQLCEINGRLAKEISCPPHFVSTCCVLVDNEAIDKIGGLADHRFGIYGAEDVDLCWRLGFEGYKSVIDCKTYVHHFSHKSVSASNIDKSTLTSENNDVFYSIWKNKITEILETREYKGKSIEEWMTTKNDEFWFIRKLNKKFQFWPNNQV